MPKPPPTLSSIIRARFMVRPPSSGTQSTTGRRCFSWKTTTVLCSMGGGAPFLAVAVTTTCTRSDEAGGWAAAARPAESKTSPRGLNEGFITPPPRRQRRAAGGAQGLGGGGGLLGRHRDQQPARSLRVVEQALDFGRDARGELDAGAQELSVGLEAAGKMPLAGAVERAVNPLEPGGINRPAHAAAGGEPAGGAGPAEAG